MSQRHPLPLTSESFLNRLQALAKEVEGMLDTLLPSLPSRLHEAMRYSVLGGGKRFRSYLVWASSGLFDVSLEEAMKTAASLELVHAYSLVHDDLPSMDDADLRRGKPSCHKVFGEETAILVGDALIPLAFQILGRLNVSPAVRLDLIEKLSCAIGSSGLVAGQMMDLGKEGPRSTLEDLLEQQHLKTGVLFGYATESGAILGGATPEDRKTLKDYGLKIGQAFQMLDDWLDGYGNEIEIGKACGQDVSKFTFLNLLGSVSLQEKIEETLEDACGLLSPFGEKALPLKEAAAYILGKKI